MQGNRINRDFNQSGPLIPWARDARTGNAVILSNIRPIDKRSIPENLKVEEYDEAKHKGHLHCYDCDARVTMVRAVESKAGSNFGEVPAHYTTVPNSPHADICETTRRREISLPDRNKIDRTKGFRIHLNLFRSGVIENLNNEFGPAAGNGPYGRDRFKARLIGPEAETLRQMETFAVNRIDDLIEFLSKKEVSRIKESRVIHRNASIPFSDFVLSYDPDLENGIHKKFIRFLRGVNKWGKKSQPVMMEIITDRSYGGRSLKYGEPILSRPIVIPPEREGGKPVIIRPQLISRSYEMDWTFTQPGKYLAVGRATMERAETLDAIEYIISMRVAEGKQVKKADLSIIRAENEKHHQMREKRAGKGPDGTNPDMPMP